MSCVCVDGVGGDVLACNLQWCPCSEMRLQLSGESYVLTGAQKRRLTTDWFIIILCLGFVMRLGALGGCIDSWAALAGRTGVQGTTTSVSTTVLGMVL